MPPPLPPLDPRNDFNLGFILFSFIIVLTKNKKTSINSYKITFGPLPLSKF